MTATNDRNTVTASVASVELGSNTNLEWQNICVKAGGKTLVDGIDGRLCSGEMCALMGPSGAGKTTLLQVIGQRLKSANKLIVEGCVTVDKHPVTESELREMSFVMQDDLLYSTSTVRESIHFSASLRLPDSVSAAQKQERVDEAIRIFGLENCADTTIGGDMIKGISGGEKKRTCIAIELVTGPRICFLDEPTSGLDSHSAFNVVKCLEKLAKRGCLILCTIHQPSSRVFQLFQRLLVLRAGGHLFFMGSIRSLDAALAENGLSCPAQYSFADHIIDLVQEKDGEDLDAIAAQLLGREPSCAGGKSRAFHAVSLSRRVTQTLSMRVTEARSRTRLASFWLQFTQVFLRSFRQYIRDTPTLIGSIIVNSISTLLVALVFLGAGDVNSDKYTLNTHFGALLMPAIGGMFGATNMVVMKLPLARTLFTREIASRTYSPSAYFLAFIMVEIGQQLVQALIAFLIVYWTMGLNGRFVGFVGTYWLSATAFGANAFVWGALLPKVELAAAILPALLTPQLIFAGFFIRPSQMPTWLRWVQWVCMLKYSIATYLHIEFDPVDQWDSALQEQVQALYEDTDTKGQGWMFALPLLGLTAAFWALGIVTLISRASVHG